MPIHYALLIYSNDGTKHLYGVSTAYNGDEIVVSETGVSSSLDTYTYSGNKKFLGIATSANATTPTYAIGDSFSTGSSDMTVYIVEGELETKPSIIIKNPISIIGSKIKKVVVDNINMTIDVWTKEVSAGLITFTVEGTSYNALSGMNWHEWCNSEYNTSEYGYRCYYETDKVMWGGQSYVSIDGTYTGALNGLDIIIPNFNYLHYIMENGGSND